MKFSGLGTPIDSREKALEWVRRNWPWFETDVEQRLGGGDKEYWHYEPIVAYRYDRWPRVKGRGGIGVWLKAECQAKTRHLVSTWIDVGDHEAPSGDCSCGYYSLEEQPIRNYSADVRVWRVELKGRYIYHRKTEAKGLIYPAGYRSEYLRYMEDVTDISTPFINPYTMYPRKGIS